MRFKSSASDGPRASLGLKFATGCVVLFLHLPIVFVILYAFDVEDRAFTFPPPGFTFRWFELIQERQDFWDALELSLKVAATATGMALVLGTLLAAAIYRSKFFGREAISLLVILPIALPGIVSGIALRSAINALNDAQFKPGFDFLFLWDKDTVFQINFGFWTILIGHATFCVVLVYNNVIARFRRTGQSQIEASMDLGGSIFQTFIYIVLPNIATALLAGGMLAFALSFDEIIVTTFTAEEETTLPIWIRDQLFRPSNRPLTNVAAVIVIATTLIPILGAYRLTRDTVSQ